MVARRDLNAPLTDTLRSMLVSSTKKDTVPFGQKSATAGEGINYTTSSGDMRRWDGDTLAAYDSRITAGQKAVEAASADLVAAHEDLAAARDRIARVESATDPATLGTTAADQINSRRLIVGRDAILTGTVDVAQLNVTEQMSAELVKAMTVESKKLVVTEEAVMNQLTVIQGIVTPELLAKKIDVQRLGADLVTAGAIQTDSATNAGVKITKSGYVAYDADGKQSVRINGKDNLMVGSFSTNIEGKTGVKISTRQSVSAVDWYSSNAGPSGQGTLNGAHGFAFLSSPGSLGSTLFSLGAMNRADGLNNDDPQILFHPFDKSVNFTGKFGKLGSAMRTGQVTVPAIPGGSYTDVKVSFGALTSAAGVCVLPSLVAANKTEFSHVITNDSNTGFEIRIANKSSNNSGTIWMKYVALAISN